LNKAVPYPSNTLYETGPQKFYSGADLLQIAMPIGGIGAGSICLNGYGGLQDFSIHNRPANSALPDGQTPSDAGFAVLHIQGQNITRLVEGPLPPEKISDQGLKSQGYRGGGHEGLPRFRNCTFTGEYPFGRVTLTDPSIPLMVKLTGFNPFIPLDIKHSAIPCAILEYTLQNTSQQVVDFQFSYHLSHLAPGAKTVDSPGSGNSIMTGKGIYFWNEEPSDIAAAGSASLSVIGHEPLIKAMWYRGGWFDGISALWKELSEGQFETNDGARSTELKGRNGGSILMQGVLNPGESISYPVLITWHMPNVPYTWGQIEESCSECCSPDSANPLGRRCWRPYYVNYWNDARDVALYIHEHYTSLRQRTQAFHDALFASSLPAYVLEAVSANLAIIKSPTILLQENGDLWGWEGCFCEKGCCPGSCTHVWNYAQAIPHLFPQLERTLRDQELNGGMNAQGHMVYRSSLPAGPIQHNLHAAADGQLGGVMKVYREWQVSGDRQWLERIYPLVKRSMDFCIENWDPYRRGVVEEPHHNTYDIEFWGPDGMCTSFYLGALTAMAALAKDSDHPLDAPSYQELAQKGAKYLDQTLFNGEYYEQKVAFTGLRDTSFSQLVAGIQEDAPAELKLLKKEGPKYQYGSGCLSDGVIGAWLARMCGLESPQLPENVSHSLKSIFQYNFRETLWEHANLQRPGYALGDEPGLLLCTWPKGGKPTLPFVYSDEVWTGIEYQVASHLILNDYLDEGLTIVKALRSRYAGHVRNPFNEYECGNYYARAMASYALLAALSGFIYSKATRTLTLNPRLNAGQFKVFFSTASGWGTVAIQNQQVEIDLSEGELVVDELHLTLIGKTTVYPLHITARAGELTRIKIT
jgi:uncharacterized protein (DUF608 family)